MNDLKTINDDNIGGLHLLRFAPRYYFSSLDPKALVFKPGYDWIQIEVIPETSGISHDTAVDGTDDYYNQTITASLPKERPDIDIELAKHLGVACLVRVHDQNGYERIAGYAAGELFISHSSSTGEKTIDENGYKINFKGKQLLKAAFIV